MVHSLVHESRRSALSLFRCSRLWQVYGGFSVGSSPGAHSPVAESDECQTTPTATPHPSVSVLAAHPAPPPVKQLPTKPAPGSWLVPPTSLAASTTPIQHVLLISTTLVAHMDFETDHVKARLVFRARLMINASMNGARSLGLKLCALPGEFHRHRLRQQHPRASGPSVPTARHAPQPLASAAPFSNCGPSYSRATALDPRPAGGHNPHRRRAAPRRHASPCGLSPRPRRASASHAPRAFIAAPPSGVGAPCDPRYWPRLRRPSLPLGPCCVRRHRSAAVTRRLRRRASASAHETSYRRAICRRLRSHGQFRRPRSAACVLRDGRRTRSPRLLPALPPASPRRHLSRLRRLRVAGAQPSRAHREHLRHLLAHRREYDGPP